MLWRMRSLIVVAVVAGCGGPDAGGDVDTRAERILRRMTLEEKVDQMHGTRGFSDEGIWPTPDNDRLGVPGFRMVDGPRGVSGAAGPATAFPVGMARGASWDPALEERIGEAIGMECAARGGTVLLAPVLNILRHPGWGRAQETYGEDPHHMARMGVAFVRGAERHVLTSAKHFACNSIEESRFEVDVAVDERTLREIYLPAFRAVVDEDVGSIMSAYNQVNGAYAAENAHLLSEVLKGEWGFRGFVESDWLLGTRSTTPSALAGLDIEMPAALYYGRPLVAAVERGEVPEEVVDEAVRRILRRKLELEARPPPPPLDVIESPAHRDLAREAAERSMVLLRNEAGALPLLRAAASSIAVVGSLADTPNIGDRGSSSVAPSEVITPLRGIMELAAPATVVPVPVDVLTPEQEAMIAGAGAAVVVVGLTHLEEGEYIPVPESGGDRESLELPAAHDALVRAVAALNARTIVVLMGGSALTIGFAGQVEAILMAWYPGMEGGRALARLLFGEVSPSGRLPITFPASLDQLPPFDNVSLEVTYGYFHGYRHVDREGLDPLYPFGFGLGYTTFHYERAAVDAPVVSPGATVVVTADVTNTGTVAGEETVQVYAAVEGSAVERPVRVLAGFTRLALPPGETRTASIPIRVDDLAFWDAAAGAFVVERLPVRLEVGSSSRDLPLSTDFRIE